MIIVIANRQRTKSINSRLLKQITAALFAQLEITDAELGINIVAAREMTLVNETFLRHGGPTDVVTFDYSNPVCGARNAELGKLHGEIFICVEVAVVQAAKFKTNWQSEVVRYVIHGILHLMGHSDSRAAARRRMKHEENRLLRLLSRRFSLAQLARADRLSA
jgi:probable rRNA maturation factor